MNILWVINGIREHQYTMLGLDRNSGRASGTWLEAAYRAAKGNKDIHPHLAATHDVPELMYDTHEGNTFYILPNRGGACVTIDAIGTQKKIAKAITDTGADYILEVKANQRKLKEAIEQNIIDDMRHRRIRNDEAEEYEDSHGRMVYRHCFIYSEKHFLGEMAREWANYAPTESFTLSALSRAQGKGARKTTVSSPVWDVMPRPS